MYILGPSSHYWGGEGFARPAFIHAVEHSDGTRLRWTRDPEQDVEPESDADVDHDNGGLPRSLQHIGRWATRLMRQNQSSD